MCRIKLKTMQKLIIHLHPYKVLVRKTEKLIPPTIFYVEDKTPLVEIKIHKDTKIKKINEKVLEFHYGEYIYRLRNGFFFKVPKRKKNKNQERQTKKENIIKTYETVSV